MSRGTDRLDQMIKGVHERSPSGESMMLPVVSEYKHGYVKCIHRVSERFVNTRNVVFGGYIAALVDDVSGHAAKTVLPDDKTYSTSELSVSFFRPALATDGELLLEGFLINESRRSYHIEVTIKRKDGKLIAKGRAVYALSDRKEV
jgi:uncharacterized protein (TIGR00369 family)